jgi:Tfp pilus assembly protein PilN
MDLSLNYGLQNCAGAEVNILGDGTFAIRIVELSINRKLIHIDKKKEDVVNLSGFSKINVKKELALSLTGKGILIKKTAMLESLTEQNLRQIFPGFDPSTFYVQHFISGEFSYLSFIRKEIADQVLDAFRKQGTRILMFSLGPFAVDQVIPQLNNYDVRLQFNCHQIILNERKEWLEYQYAIDALAEYQLKVDIEVIPEQYLLAYGTAFQLILNDRLDLIKVGDEQSNAALNESVAERKFKKNGVLLLSAIFALLMINFLLFSYYNSSNLELAGKVGQLSNRSSDRQKLTDDLNEKEQQVKQLGWNHGQNYSFICDQIGKSVPAAISLSELNVNGLKDKYESTEKPTLPETGTVKITGSSANVYVINDWIYALKQQHWVKNVQLEKYATDLQKDAQVFTLTFSY